MFSLNFSRKVSDQYFSKVIGSNALITSNRGKPHQEKQRRPDVLSGRNRHKEESEVQGKTKHALIKQAAPAVKMMEA